MDVGLLATELSSAFPSPTTQRAALRFLSLPDPSAALGKVYRFLVWHHTLRTALGHLEAAGADLATLEIPVQEFRDTFHNKGRVLWNVAAGSHITARDLVEIYELHRRLQTEPIEQMSEAGVDRFALISGRAYRVRYPHYEHRVGFDSDVMAPDFPAALAMVAALEPRGYSLESLRVQRFGDSPSAKFMVHRAESGHLVSVDILVGGYHAHRGPIYERSDTVASDGRLYRIARPEDMLVMLAARIEYKGIFALFNFNDAAVILDTDGSGLSWDLICDTAEVSGLETTLAVLLLRAEDVLDRSPVPAEVWQRLEGGIGSGVRRKLTERAADMRLSLGPHRRGSVSDLAFRSWRIAVQTRQQRRADAPALASRAIVALQRRILLKQIRTVRSGRPRTRGDRLLARTRTQSGALCEVSPHLAASQGCIASQDTWHGSTSARTLLSGLADQLAQTAAEHECARLQFHLWSRDGT